MDRPDVTPASEVATLPRMAPSKQITVRVSAKIRAALDEYVSKRKETDPEFELANEIRTHLLALIGRQDLADTMVRGRPPTSEKPRRRKPRSKGD